MPVSWFDGYATVQTDVPVAPITVGASWRPGDLRVVALSSSGSRAFTVPAGWTVLHDSTSGGAAVSRRLTIIARELAQGDADSTIPVTGSAVSNIAIAAVTVRGADNAAVLASAPAVQGSDAASTSVTAPAVATGDGLLLTTHYVTRVAQADADTGAWGAPDGMATAASSLSDNVRGYNVLLAAETDATSGERTATAASAGSWTGASLYIPPATPRLVETLVADTASMTTAPFTPDVGDVLVAKLVTGHSALWPSRVTVGGQPCVTLARVSGANYCQVIVCYLTVTTPGQVTAVGELSPGFDARYSPTLIVERWANARVVDPAADNAFATGQAVTGTPSVAITTKAAESAVTWASGDWFARTGTPVYLSGASEDYRKQDGAVSLYSAWQNAAEPGPQTIGLSAPASQQWSLAGMELRSQATADDDEPAPPASQNLTPERRTGQTAHHAPVVEPGPAELAPEPGAGQTEHADPAIEPGATVLSPDAHEPTVEHPAAALTPGPVALAPDVTAAGTQHDGPALEPGPVELAPDPAAAGTQHGDPAVGLGAVELTVDEHPVGVEHVGPDVGAGPVTLSPDVAAAGTEHDGPALTPGAVGLAPDGATAGAQHSPPALAPGPAAIEPGAQPVGVDHPAAAVEPGPVELAVAEPVALVADYGAPAIGRGPVGLTPERTESGVDHYGPAVTRTVNPTAHELLVAHPAPTVGRGPVGLTPERTDAETRHGRPGVGALAAAIDAVEQLVGVDHPPATVGRGPVELEMRPVDLRVSHGEPVVGLGAVELAVGEHTVGTDHGDPAVGAAPTGIGPVDEQPVGVEHSAPTVGRGSVELAPTTGTGSTDHDPPAVEPGPIVVRVPAQRPSTAHGAAVVWVGPITLRPTTATARAISAGEPEIERGPRRVGPLRSTATVEHPVPLIVRGTAVLVVPGRLAVTSTPDGLTVTSTPDGLTVTDDPARSRLDVIDGW